MRLIDADVLKLELQRHQIESLIEHSEEKNVFDVINEQPTAFDREKVVAELEKESQYCVPLGGESFVGINTYKAINIVKGGGKDAENN